MAFIGSRYGKVGGGGGGGGDAGTPLVAGDTLLTVRDPGEKYLDADGSIITDTNEPELAPLLPVSPYEIESYEHEQTTASAAPNGVAPVYMSNNGPSRQTEFYRGFGYCCIADSLYRVDPATSIATAHTSTGGYFLGNLSIAKAPDDSVLVVVSSRSGTIRVSTRIGDANFTVQTLSFGISTTGASIFHDGTRFVLTVTTATHSYNKTSINGVSWSSSSYSVDYPRNLVGMLGDYAIFYQSQYLRYQLKNTTNTGSSSSLLSFVGTNPKICVDRAGENLISSSNFGYVLIDADLNVRNISNPDSSLPGRISSPAKNSFVLSRNGHPTIYTVDGGLSWRDLDGFPVQGASFGVQAIPVSEDGDFCIFDQTSAPGVDLYRYNQIPFNGTPHSLPELLAPGQLSWYIKRTA